ncbi:tRNA uridine-5-carboxymethylaminomethyl(34) synthesis enzyme MnmG [bacterium]|nr:tRNA uridine-5-carboxymethylaminomethyl(34) synthesis enzyme MnmG [bacterium]
MKSEIAPNPPHFQDPPRFQDPTRYDVIVIGAGHAGCEAAWASSRMGMTTLLLTISIDQIAHMSCNPAVGGLAKGHLVREIDALGGLMAMAIDATGIQYRILNTKKGPAVRSSRAQADMYGYKTWVRERLEAQEGLHIKQGMVEGFLMEEGEGVRRIGGVYTQAGEEFLSTAVVVASGTFLNGLIHVGMTNYPAGRAGEFPSVGLSGALEALDLQMGRLKTGTTPRLDAKTIDFDRCQAQYGDEVPKPFSFKTRGIHRPQVPCWITRTNQATHDAIRGGLDRSPLYKGVIKGVGPRYCPSIEDKIVRFPDKTGHQVFLEPEGLQTREYYPNGVSTSLPIDVQIKMLRTIQGLEEVQIMRPGYAIEYDFVSPTQLGPDLMIKAVHGLYLAGQINGTSGYEEAAAQGLLAGINAALKVKGEPPLTLGRDEAYMGVLVDDLITKGVTEPYRLFTSRAEYRLILREDNADLRLMEKGYRAGLITEEEIGQLREKARVIENGLEEVRNHRVTVSLAGGPPKGTSFAQVLKQPEISYGDLESLDPGFPPIREEEAARQVEIQIKYEGYIARQLAMVGKMARLESMAIPEDLDYACLHSLSREVRDRLEDVRPASLGQASRIPGITPAAVSALMVYLEGRKQNAKRRMQEKAAD